MAKHEGQTTYKDEKRVLECLQKSLKVADTCMDSSTNVQLFIEILNEYLYYYIRGNEAITVKYLNSLLALINTNMSNLDQAADTSSITNHYQSTLKYIQFRKVNVGEGGRSFADILVSV